MSSLGPSGDAVKLMQKRLQGAENDTKGLAKMLVDLGISPSAKANSSTISSVNSTPDFLGWGEQLDQNISGLHRKEKAVHFKDNPMPSILKKNIEPLKVNLKIDPIEKATQYNKLVTRLCKTESVIQTLKLSLCAIQTSNEAASKEKDIVIETLKEEINAHENTIKKQGQRISDEQHHCNEINERYSEAERQVKNLQNQLQIASQNTIDQLSNEENIRGKFSRKIEEVKQEVDREKEVRVAIEDSHLSLLSRVQDMENELQAGRLKVDSLVADNRSLTELNNQLNAQSTNWNQQASDLNKTLNNLKQEIDDKEEAIKRLISEQHNNNVEQSTMAFKQDTMNNELRQCNVILEAQRASFSQLENENSDLKMKLAEEKGKCSLLEEEREKSERIGEERKREKKEWKEEAEEKMKKEIKKAISSEKQHSKELENRVNLLESCIKAQEKVVKEKEENLEEIQKENDLNLFEERKKVDSVVKERDQAIRSRDNLMKDLNRVNIDGNRDKEYLQQQFEELRLDLDVSAKEKMQLNDENKRLLDRISSLQQQEDNYRKAREQITNVNQAKSQLSYENGRLQTRVEQLEEELRKMATSQSQLLQFRATNKALEQKYSQLTTELANLRVNESRNDAYIKKLESGMQLKESDFHLAIQSRDEALGEKQAAVAQLDLIKDQERIRISNFQQELTDCRNDNERLSSNLNEALLHHNQLQLSHEHTQTQLGKKDTQLNNLSAEKSKLQSHINGLQVKVQDLEGQLNGRDFDEQLRLTPALEALEQARHENVKLASSLEDVLRSNQQLKNDLDKMTTDLEIQRERNSTLQQQLADRDDDVIMTSRNHDGRLNQLNEQHKKERNQTRKQTLVQMNELKKENEAIQSRNSQLVKGNTDLRGRVSEKERIVAKLKFKIKDQKNLIDGYKKEKENNFTLQQKIKDADNEYKQAENLKKSYMKKANEQAAVINAFNQEVTSVRDDMVALSQAQKVAKETTLKLEAEVNKERAEKQILINKIKASDMALKRALEEKQKCEEKLKQVQIESIQVHENLQEASSWFKTKFNGIEASLSRNQPR